MDRTSNVVEPENFTALSTNFSFTIKDFSTNKLLWASVSWYIQFGQVLFLRPDSFHNHSKLKKQYWGSNYLNSLNNLMNLIH